MIGFAGPRVIKETTHQDLPAGFQTAEFLEARTDRRCDASFQTAGSAWSTPRLSCAFKEVTYRAALAWLYSTQLFGIKLGLENIRAC